MVFPSFLVRKENEVFVDGALMKVTQQYIDKLFKPIAIVINICVLIKDLQDLQKAALLILRNLFEVITEEQRLKIKDTIMTAITSVSKSDDPN